MISGFLFRSMLIEPVLCHEFLIYGWGESGALAELLDEGGLRLVADALSDGGDCEVGVFDVVGEAFAGFLDAAVVEQFGERLAVVVVDDHRDVALV